MGLTGALHIGRTGLLAHQAAIEVTGNNLANLATPGYHRQVINLATATPQMLRQGLFIGRGVEIASIVRSVDNALTARTRGGIADQSATATRMEVLTQIEALQNELSDVDLSTELNEFFNAWSELANQPLDNSLRGLVVNQGLALSSFIRNLRQDEIAIRNQVDTQIDQAVIATNDVLDRIEQINDQITQAEGGLPGGGAGALRDQRDRLLAELSQYLDISVHENSSGAADVFVGSLPIVLNGDSRGLEVRRQTIDDELQMDVVLAQDGSPLSSDSGRIGALIRSRVDDVNNAINVLNDFANQLIFQVNRLHSQGQGVSGFNSITGTNRVIDTTIALNDPDTELGFAPVHGSFRLHVTQISTQQRTTSTVNVDLDGIGTDTSLDDLVTDITGIADVTATVTPDGRLQISANGSDFEISFSNDTSGTLAALGINTFFTGTDASDINVNSIVNGDPGKLAVALGHVPGDNANALALAALANQGIPELNGLSLNEKWARHIEDYAIRLGQAASQLEADGIVVDNLQAQQQSVSGVNPDEEAINLLSFQRAYQGSARFLTVVDEMLETLMGLV